MFRPMSQSILNRDSHPSSSQGRRVLVTGGSGFIGTHLIARLLECGYEVANVDILPPQLTQNACWHNVSILDAKEITRVVAEFRPTMVVHLAAYASVEAKSMAEFRVNIDGTANLLAAIKNCDAVERFIATSSQHVRRPGSGAPTHECDYVPYEFYGESKVITENLTRQAGLACCWSIIRPTAVWGPYQPPLADGVWRIIKRRLYLHPSNDPVMRSYGYVKNVVWQIERLLCAPVDKVNCRMFYVGDENIRQYEWVNGFARALTGRNVRTMPLGVIRALASLGDALRAVGLSFPMYASRLHNLTTPNPVPIKTTLDLLGPPPYSLNDGIQQTVKWLDEYWSASKRQLP
jgi:nucleoside-diphosphate-sugar epimerase